MNVANLQFGATLCKTAVDLLTSKQGIAWPTATITVHECDCGVKAAQAFVISEEGTGKIYIRTYSTKANALKAADSFWCCWVALARDASELKAGGVGFACQTRREWGTKWINEQILLGNI